MYSLHQNIPSLHKLDHPNGCWNLTTTAIWDSLTKSLLIHCCDRKAGNWGGSPILDTKELMSSFNDTPIGEWTKFMEKFNWFENFIWTCQIWNEECMDMFKKKRGISKFPERSIQERFHDISTDANALVWKSATSTRSSELRSPYCDSMGIKSAEKKQKRWEIHLANTQILQACQVPSARRKLSRNAPWICCKRFCKSSVCPRGSFLSWIIGDCKWCYAIVATLVPCFLNQQIWEDCSNVHK